MNILPHIAILGGTGDLGSGLARQWAARGYPIIIGSRDAARAQAAAAEIGPSVKGAANAAAADAAQIVVIAVPYASHAETLAEVRDLVSGKIVVDAVVPLVPPKVSVVQLPAGQSAALEAQAILSPDTRLVAAFHNVGAAKLRAGNADCDVLVFGDDVEARKIVMTLADAAGARGIDGGVLANAVAAEALTAVLIGINRRYKSKGAGIRITGLPEN